MGEGEHILTFGKHKGLTLSQVSINFPQYVTWLAGIKTGFSFKPEVAALYKKIKTDHPDTINVAKAFIKGKCKTCLLQESHEGHKCDKARSTRNYHYHPYGKRG
jgi:hypothetical protein